VASRPTWATVDLGAIRHNASVLAGVAAPAALCAVVKAWAYGHGPVPVARAALDGGASWLAVALVEEGAALREGGVDAPVLLLSEPPADCMDDVVAFGLTPTLYTPAGVDAAAKAAAAGTAGGPVGVHVKVDTGMHRVGAAPDEALDVARAVAERAELRLDGVWTHLAVADDPADGFTAEQCRRFDRFLDRLAGAGLRPGLVHAANSAGTLAHPSSHHGLVRCGIGLYGVAPSPALVPATAAAGLRPALSLRASVSYVRRVAGGEALSYGLRYPLPQASTVATVPAGYADGVPWRLGVTGGEVLIGGRRRPFAGSVTMDQVVVDCGDDPVAPGDEVVLLGRQGDEEVAAWDWAGRVGTIAYEVLTGIGPRVPRVYREADR
jgi:alanine racemase